MKQYGNIWVGNDEDCRKAQDNKLPTVHVCRSCFLKHKGKITDNDLVLDVVDMDEHEQAYLFKQVVVMMNWCMGKKDILIHCNQGKSRSPFFALCYLYHCGEYAEAWKLWKDMQ